MAKGLTGHLLLTLSLLAACTMPLPQSSTDSSGLVIPELPQNSPLAQAIETKTARYSTGSLSYLDITTCTTENCISRLSSLSPSLRYEFFFSDRVPVLGQNPVFSNPSGGNLSPFRRVIQVTVPDGYQPNTLRSSEDVLNSGFRTEPTNRVENNPLVAPAVVENTDQPLGNAWSAGEAVQYLELGTVPYSANQNRLGVGVVYFMRNRDSTDLPSQPLPIFDSVPGDLLYSPVRQVFRAVSENQIDNVNDDPALSIRSQEELLQAVNEGLFQLEDTQEYFNYPIIALRSSPTESPETPLPETRFNLFLDLPQNMPSLPADNYYALWVTNTLNEARLLLQFRVNANGRLSLINNNELDLNAAIFQFSNTELGTFRQFILSIEASQVTEPTGSTLLQANYNGRNETQLSVPFATAYSALQDGFYMLAAPTDTSGNNQRSGLWLTQRTDGRTQNVPFNANLEPGIVLSLPPRGWSYNAWIRNNLSSNIWLETGRFEAVNRPDSRVAYYDENISAFPYPGEDFLRNAPLGMFFPVNLPSTGERELVVSLEPKSIEAQRPFFALFRQFIVKGTEPLTNQALPFTPVQFPTLNLRLERVNESE